MPFQRITCPHCLREVSVGADAICPACRGNTAERNAATEGLAPVEFVDGEKLPSCCVLCARPAGRHVEVGEKNETKPDAWFSLSRLLGALGGAIAVPLRPAPDAKVWKISVKLPVCESHAESRYLSPLHVDYARYRITVPAHRNFIAQWKPQRPATETTSAS